MQMKARARVSLTAKEPDLYSIRLSLKCCCVTKQVLLLRLLRYNQNSGGCIHGPVLFIVHFI